ncbi:MAG: hypothetical protein HRT64_11120 [Erythrobacter sp.]|nr:hypothetical protein [Erythrobacter sp.]
MSRLGAAAAVAAAGGLSALFVRAANAAEAIADTANKANTTTDALQELRFAANQNGTEFRDMDDALTRLTRRASLFVTEGGGPAAKAIEALNLQLTDTNGNLLQSDQIFDQIADRFGEMESNAEMAALASQLFGEDAGPRLVPLLAQGRGAIEELRDSARDLGAVMESSLVQQGARISAEMRALSQVIGNQLNAAILSVTPQIMEMVAAFSANIPVVLDNIRLVGELFGIFDAPLENRIADATDELAAAERALSIQRQAHSGLFQAGQEQEIAALEERRANAEAVLENLKAEKAAMDALAEAAATARENTANLFVQGDGSGGGSVNPEILSIGEDAEAALREHHSRMEEEERRHQEKMYRLRAIGAETQIDAVLTGGRESLRAMSATSNQALKALQAYSIAEAGINQARAGLAALASPEPLTLAGRFAAYASITSAAAGAIAAIRGASIGGGAGGSVASASSQTSEVRRFLDVNISGGSPDQQDEIKRLFTNLREGLDAGYTLGKIT